MKDDQSSQDIEETAEPAVSPVELLLFVVRAAKRHLRLGIALAVAIAVAGVTAAMILPARYEAEARILFLQSATVAAALSTPNQHSPNAVTPVGESIELLMQKSNLLKVVDEADLLTHFRTHRPTALRIKDYLLDMLRGPLSDEKTKNMLAETLQTWANVSTKDKDTLTTIHVTWSDRDMVVQLTKLLEKRFLNMRKEQELSGINLAIAINEDELKNAALAIDTALEEVERSRDQERPKGASQSSLAEKATSNPAPLRHTVRAPVATAVAAPVDNKRLMAQLAETRQRAQQLEENWQRRLVDLKFQLNDMRTTYGPEHPIIVQQQAKIKDASNAPIELTQLREREHKLLAELESATLAQEQAQATQVTTTSSVIAAPHYANEGYPTAAERNRLLRGGGTLVIAEREEDPRVAPAKANLVAAIKRYTDVTQRLDAARIDLTSSQVALKYRYAVVAEPERPRKATKPKRPLIAIGAILAGVVIGFLVGSVRDLLSGRLFEPWQVRTAGIDVLGEVHMPRT